MRCFSACFAVLFASSAAAGPMQLYHQGRVLNSAGDPVEGVHDITARVLDGAGASQFEETYTDVRLQNGYFAVQLGSGATLDTSVFLEHGAMHLELQVDGSVLSTSPLGGYPFVVAQQSLLGMESTAQQTQDIVVGVASDVGDVGTRVGSLRTDMQSVAEDVQALDSSLATLAEEVARIQLSQVRPRYSKDCQDWQTSGWNSLLECRQDGRWHYYAATTGTFDTPQGVRDWHAASREGADTKLRIGLEWYDVTARDASDPTDYVWVFVKEGHGHLSFVVRATGQIDEVHATPGDATFDNRWATSSFGNWHYFTRGYTRRDDVANEAQYDGTEFWDRY